MRLSDLMTRPGGRRLSHSRYGPISPAPRTLLFVVEGLRGTLDAEIWLIYLGIVGGYSAGLRLIAAWRDRGGR